MANFVDLAKIHVKAGDGGNGAVNFHREKYIASGGPDGGDGGKGGDVVFLADDNLSTLTDFRYQRKYAAQSGEAGDGGNRAGKGGKDLIIRVPRGTLIKEAESGSIMADISGSEPVVVAKGGRGGAGNQHFATSMRQIPRFAKPGEPGEAYDLVLELKLLADVGLIGFPNVGKSTLISVLSAAKPKIANYHFTTLTPVLGVVRVAEETSFVMADIPGIIEGASEGVGLGHDFLRHVERCRLLLHVLDISGREGRDPIEDFETLNRELVGFSEPLAALPQIVIGNKMDAATDEQIRRVEQYMREKGFETYIVSAAGRQGTDALPGIIYKELQKLPPVRTFEPDFVPMPKQEVAPGEYRIERLPDASFLVTAPWLEQILATADLEDYESLQYFQRRLTESGIIEALVEKGAKEGDAVQVGPYEFDFIL